MLTKLDTTSQEWVRNMYISPMLYIICFYCPLIYIFLSKVNLQIGGLNT